ncbi:hypothetical protein [Serinicoccus sp. CNJ-927]|uniref:hypothetical protein n=1 Tax=Serinicoccus sp. CNJ-927 TaxID=1904970 RepID=UPI00117B715E|nr:hypothetical protein [Serinicoccus sp. CNJ-927]
MSAPVLETDVAEGDGGDQQQVRLDLLDPQTWSVMGEVDSMLLVRPPALGNVRRDLLPPGRAARRGGELAAGRARGAQRRRGGRRAQHCARQEGAVCPTGPAARLGLADGLSDDVQRVLGEPPTSFAEFARREQPPWSRRGG